MHASDVFNGYIFYTRVAWGFEILCSSTHMYTVLNVFLERNVWNQTNRVDNNWYIT